ncbi:MAG: hypothetical protein Q9227_002375 [Pyrenula ochraceoflavens]
MDIDEKPRPASGSYGSQSASRLSSADAPPSHNHYPYTSPANAHPGPPHPLNHPNQPPPAPGWIPPASPYSYSDRPDHPHHPLPPSAAYAATQRPYSHAPELSYHRPGSVSANSRSPIENSHQSHAPPMNGHDGPPSNQHTPVEPGPRHSYGQETVGGGQPPHGLPYSTSQEAMAVHHSAPLGHHYHPPPPHSSGYVTPQYDQYYPGLVQGGQQKRKPVRASQACDTCRNRKAKCDEGRPCSHCRENNLECQYRELPVPKQDRHVKEQSDKLDLILKKLDAQQEATARNERKLDQHQARFDAISQRLRLSPDHGQPAESPQVSEVKTEHLMKHESQQSPPVGNAAFNRQPRRDVSLAPDPKMLSSQNNDLTIPIQHTTYAHKLLLWPSIADLLQDYRPKADVFLNEPLTEHYVDRLELSRGLPRLYGRGQGEDKNDPGKGPSSPADSSSSRSDDQESVTVEPLTWGTGLLDPRPNMDIVPHPGGQKEDGHLNLESKVIDQLYDNYLRHIHILHPFLNRRMLNGMISKFKRRYSPDLPLKYPEHRLGSVSRKRKLDDESSSPPEPLSARTPNLERNHSKSDNQKPIERSPSNIIILLILALGKICGHTKKLPGPVPADVQTSPSSHPSQSSPSPYPNAHISPDCEPLNNMNISTPAYDGSSTASGGTSASAERPKKRNLDVIPGFAYFAVAAGMLGEHLCENRLDEAQACLLAGLYAGQLACVAASHKWISSACSIVQILLKQGILESQLPKDARSQIKNHVEALRLCFWTCLQLESDILAEIDLPPSGISRHEEYMSQQRWRLPSGYVEETEVDGKQLAYEDRLELPTERVVDEERLMTFYSTQIHLRKNLNSVHTLLYSGSDKKLDDLAEVVENMEQGLAAWRDLFSSQNMGWDDRDPQVDDMNMARVRAKFYGSSYIIQRPILNRILHPIAGDNVLPKAPAAESPASFASPSSHEASPGMAKPSNLDGTIRHSSDMAPPISRGSITATEPPNTLAGLPRKLRRHCTACVESAINSTVVFDRLIDKRLIITNIYGTAHAQFGNMLVLAVTYRSSDPYLSKLIKWDHLDWLLTRTIGFLRQYDEVSPTLKMDADILHFAQEKMRRENLNAHHRLQ